MQIIALRREDTENLPVVKRFDPDKPTGQGRALFRLTPCGTEAVAVSQIRSFLSGRFGAEARVTQLDVDFDRTPIGVRTVVIAPRSRAESNALLQSDLSDRLGRPIALRVDQVLLDPGAGSVEAQRAELQQANDSVARDIGRANDVAGLVALAAGIAPDAVTIDRDHQRVPLPRPCCLERSLQPTARWRAVSPIQWKVGKSRLCRRSRDCP